MLTFGIASLLAGFAVALAGPLFLVYPSMGSLMVMKAFVIIVIGGMGSIPGAVLGGVILGLTEEASSATYISSDYKDVVAFAVLIIILSLRPSGLFAKGAG